MDDFKSKYIKLNVDKGTSWDEAYILVDPDIVTSVFELMVNGKRVTTIVYDGQYYEVMNRIDEILDFIGKDKFAYNRIEDYAYAINRKYARLLLDEVTQKKGAK